MQGWTGHILTDDVQHPHQQAGQQTSRTEEGVIPIGQSQMDKFQLDEFQMPLDKFQMDDFLLDEYDVNVNNHLY